VIEFNALCGLIEQTNSHSRHGSLLLKSVSYMRSTARRCRRMYTALAGETGNVYRYGIDLRSGLIFLLCKLAEGCAASSAAGKAGA
jgi:hypothetical protein